MSTRRSWMPEPMSQERAREALRAERNAQRNWGYRSPQVSPMTPAQFNAHQRSRSLTAVQLRPH